MARSDILLDLVRSGARGDHVRFQKALEALVVEERAKEHHVLADRLAAHLGNGTTNGTAHASTNGVAPSGLLVRVDPQRELETLILPDVVGTAVREVVEEQHRIELLRAHNVEPRHRILLAGPPGNGKTSLAEALATELRVPLYVVRYEAVITSFLGETAVRLARLFDEVRTRRCVLFFDEFDVVGKERGDIHETGEIKRVVSSLLLQVDALPSTVVVVTATNHAELLDRAVWRRFQVRLTLPAPTPVQTKEWLRRLEATVGTLGHGHDALARALRGASFAELHEFALDIRRRMILTAPNTDARAIVRDRLAQWTHRSATRPRAMDDRDA